MSESQVELQNQVSITGDIETEEIATNAVNSTETLEEEVKDEESIGVESYEDVLKICGEAGLWQLKLFSLTGFGGMLTAYHALAYAFIGAKPEHWCKLPHNSSLDTKTLINLTIRPIPGNIGSDGKLNGCKRCSIKGDWESGMFTADDVDCSSVVPCSSYEYNKAVFNSTIVTEFDLVCDHTYFASLIQACYMFGILVGSPLSGAMSDKLGRRRVILISAVLFCVAGPAIGVAPNYWALMCGRFFLGLSTPGCFATSFILMIENIGLDWRGLSGNLFNLWFAFGYVTLPLFAYFLREWRYLQLALCGPSISLLISWWFISESPRWLLRVGKIVEAEVILRNMARMNNKELPGNFTDQCDSIGTAKDTMKRKRSWIEHIKACKVMRGFFDLLCSHRLRLRTLVIYFCWFSIGMIYYGVALNSSNLSADPYIYTLVGGVLEIPSSFMVPPLIGYFGRRFVFAGLIFLTGLALLSSLATPNSYYVFTLAMLGKLTAGGAFALIYVYASEIFPTLLRNYGLGSASLVGRIGSIVAPFVVDLAGMESTTYPTILFGAVAVASGITALLLPETKGRRLPETVSEVEAMV